MLEVALGPVHATHGWMNMGILEAGYQHLAIKIDEAGFRPGGGSHIVVRPNCQNLVVLDDYRGRPTSGGIANEHRPLAKRVFMRQPRSSRRSAPPPVDVRIVNVVGESATGLKTILKLKAQRRVVQFSGRDLGHIIFRRHLVFVVGVPMDIATGNNALAAVTAHEILAETVEFGPDTLARYSESTTMSVP